MKIKTGDIVQHKDGELYLIVSHDPQDGTAAQPAVYVLDLQNGEGVLVPSWVKELKADRNPRVTHTGVNLLDIIKKVKL